MLSAFVYPKELVYWVIVCGVYYWVFRKNHAFTTFGILLAFLSSVLFFRFTDFIAAALKVQLGGAALVLLWAVPLALNMGLLAAYFYFLNKADFKRLWFYKRDHQSVALALCGAAAMMIFIFNIFGINNTLSASGGTYKTTTYGPMFYKSTSVWTSRGESAESIKETSRGWVRFSLPLMLICLAGMCSKEYQASLKGRRFGEK